MKKKLIGYELNNKLYDNKENSKNALLRSIAIIGLINHQMIDYPNEKIVLKTVYENDLVRSHLKKAGVLDLWFNPIYEKEFTYEVGDYLYCFKDFVMSSGIIAYKKDQIYQSECPQCITDVNHNKFHRMFSNIDHYFRHATEEEIENSKVKIIPMHSFSLKLKNKKIYHSNEDITCFVKGIKVLWEDTFKKGKLHIAGYDFYFEDIILYKTGCKEEKTTIKEWLKLTELID